MHFFFRPQFPSVLGIASASNFIKHNPKIMKQLYPFVPIFRSVNLVSVGFDFARDWAIE